MINIDELHSILSYNPDTGLFFWKIRRSNACTTGWFSGHINKRGYATIRINGKLYLAHRVAWILMYGSWPKQAIDHIDENKTNNKIDNLRLTTKSLNELNQSKPHKDSKSLFRGITKHQHKWKAQFRAKYLGTFNTPEEAYICYCSAKNSYYDK